MNWLLLPPEIELFQRALQNFDLPAEGRLYLEPLRAELLARLQSAATHPGYTRTEVCRWNGWHKATLQGKLKKLELPSPTRRNERLAPTVTYGLLAPWLTIFARPIALPPTCPMQLVMVTIPEAELLAQALAAWPDTTATGIVDHMRAWLGTVTDIRATLPYPVVVAHWASVVEQMKKATGIVTQGVADASRRGLFYRTKITSGVLHLVEPTPVARHLDRCHVYTSEVAVLTRNTWVMNWARKASEPMPEYGDVSNSVFVPMVEIAPISPPDRGNRTD